MKERQRKKKNENPNRRPVIAAIVASVMMLALGLAFRAMVARLKVPVTVPPIVPEALEGFPVQIGNWTGQEVPLDEAIAEKTDADALISRQYSRKNGLDSVFLYVACGVTWEMMFHRPEVCYPGNGWTLLDHSSMELPINNGMTLPCTIFRFSRGELDKQEMVVLYYVIADGRFYSDVSLLRSRVWGVFAIVDHIAQVQIIASSGGIPTPDSMKRIASEFAIASASSIAELFQDIEQHRYTDSHLGIQEEGSHR
jgi:EpsI family protein